MDEQFKQTDPRSIDTNVFERIGSEWMLLTGGTEDSFNTMTASWGGMGVLWDRNVCFCFIRPTRYTYHFFEKSDAFSLCFFKERYRKVLEYCGSHSGRDVNKIEKTGITPVFGMLNTVYFQESSLVLICRKIYFQDLIPDNFLDSRIHTHYPQKDYHRFYIGEIVQCLKK
ncbi:MAG: flavin reductase [Spirochaetes bacterium DG_61]|nr:MAG: flavin reductase [Spirochaetes bacterium DG_61]